MALRQLRLDREVAHLRDLPLAHNERRHHVAGRPRGGDGAVEPHDLEVGLADACLRTSLVLSASAARTDSSAISVESSPSSSAMSAAGAAR